MLANDDTKARAKVLSEKYEWEKEDALKICIFVPVNYGPIILLEKTSAV